jgi:iron complex outermembrane receptor protein
MRRSSRSAAFAVLAATSALLSAPARGADDTLEEITVTAQRRAESAQAVPIAMSVFSQLQLEQLGIETSSDLTRLTPNLTWSPSGVTNAVGLRGVVDTIFTTNQVGSVAIVIDEVGMNSPVTNTFAMLDMQRVEVLRGPQVTLYGRSTTGGAINFVSRRPDPRDGVNGYATVRLGRFSQADFEAAIGVPAGERSAWRVAAKSENRDGIMTNQTLDSKDTDVARQLLRAAFASEWGDSASLLASAYYGANRGESSRYKAVGLTDPATGSPCTVRHADRVRDVAPLESLTARRERVDVRRSDHRVAVASQMVSTVLVGNDQQDIWTGHRRNINHFERHCVRATAAFSQPFAASRIGRQGGCFRNWVTAGTTMSACMMEHA